MPQNVAVTGELAHTSPYTSASKQIPNPNTIFIAAGIRQLMAPLPSLFSVRSHSTSTAPVKLASAPMPAPAISSAATVPAITFPALTASASMPPIPSRPNFAHGASLLRGACGKFTIGASSLPTQSLPANVSSVSNAPYTRPNFTQLLSTAQAQQAALLQTLIGNAAGPSQHPAPYHTTTPSTQTGLEQAQQPRGLQQLPPVVRLNCSMASLLPESFPKKMGVRTHWNGHLEASARSLCMHLRHAGGSPPT
jgi:hypothetical protein